MDFEDEWDEDTITVDDYFLTLDDLYFLHFTGTGEVDRQHLLLIYTKRALYARKLLQHEHICRTNGFCNVGFRYRRILKLVDQFLLYYSFQ